MRVSLVVTVLNEGASIARWMDAVDAQTRRPEEIIVVDGGSTDETWALLQAWSPCSRLVLLRECGATIARGRNVAIELADGDVIAVTDVGASPAPDWLERLLAPLADPMVDVASGFFEARPAGSWERALAATTLPLSGEIHQTSFLPSSRSVAFRRAWFSAGVRYPEWLDYCEDLVWDLALRRAGANFQTALDAIVFYEVQQRPSGYVRQYFRYARGDGKAGLFARRHAVRYGTYGAAVLVVWRRRTIELMVAAILGVVYIRKPVTRLVRQPQDGGLGQSRRVGALLLIPIQRLLGDVAKMAGYPFGLAWRARQYGGLGWRTGWKRISPDGRLRRPESRSKRSLMTTTSPFGESPEQWL
jgi:cellulose synthase/poly-beta-1,6-N-acetylglucosamine synthase-like glycosyltransferase